MKAGWQAVVVRYRGSSRCDICGSGFELGQEVMWKAPSGPFRHMACHERAMADEPAAPAPELRDGWRALTARYPGRCAVCRGEIRPGDEIVWRAGVTRHPACHMEAEAAAPAPSAAPAAAAATPAQPAWLRAGVPSWVQRGVAARALAHLEARRGVPSAVLPAPDAVEVRPAGEIAPAVTAQNEWKAVVPLRDGRQLTVRLTRAGRGWAVEENLTGEAV